MRLLTILPAAFAASAILAQTAPSDSLFGVDQVVEVQLTFSDPDFWTTLVTYYTNDQGEELTGSVTITDQTGTWSYDSISVALKGNSSYSHPGNKKSFKLDFNDHIDQKFHGMTKLHFNNCWSDPTFLREKVFFDYCQEQGIRAPRVQYANIYMNGTLWGFYNMVEAVDKEFLDRHIDDDAGNLFKAADNFGMGGGGGGAAEADLKWYGTDQADYYDRYELKTNEAVNDWSDLLDLLDMLNNAPDAYLETNFPARWNWHDLLRSLALDNLFGNLDAYIQSARNYYLYHDATNDEWQWVHWDANMAFGSYPAQGQNALTLSPTYVAANRPLMTRLMAIESFRRDYLNEYCWAKENFTNGYLDPRIDSLATMIQPHVAADPNKQYSLAQFTTNITSDITVQGGGGGGGGGQQTILGLKSFVTARNSNLASSLDCSTVDLSEIAVEGAFQVYPNPATEVLWLRLVSGAPIAATRVLDALGRAVPVPVQSDGLDVSGLAPGLYLVNVSDGAVMRTARFEKR